MRHMLPVRLQGVLWSRSIKELDLQNDKIYIIHQIFSRGRMEDILWLFQAYPKTQLRNVFVSHPYKDYDPARFHFVKDFLLDLKDTLLPEQHYVKNTPRDLR